MTLDSLDPSSAETLVAEDDPRSRKLLEGYLRSVGYRVRTAGDGPTALAQVRQQVPDVVLLDVMMPGMTGYEVCQALKQDPRTRMTQVILVTALASSPDLVSGLDVGADDYVTKPVRREEFLAKVRAALRVRALLLELEGARAALQARNDELELKKILSQTLVHDLKNPLAAILGNLDLLELHCDAGARYMVQRGKQGATRMHKMILDLLDVERLEQGRLEPSVKPVDLVHAVGAVIEESRVSAELNENVLVAQVPEQAWAMADAGLLRRVLDNLVSNALGHSPRSAEIVVAVSERAEGLELSVRDHGPGIPEHRRESVFDKYAQLEARKEGASSNRGLGLTFCRLAVEAMGGTIWIDEAPGGGAIFRTLLPDATPGHDGDPEFETLALEGPRR